MLEDQKECKSYFKDGTKYARNKKLFTMRNCPAGDVNSVKTTGIFMISVDIP